MSEPRKIGEKTAWGKIVAIKFIEGERYYFTANGNSVSFLPAELLETPPKKA